MRKRVKILIIGLVLVLSACGMQGDLYLPEQNSNKSEQT